MKSGIPPLIFIVGFMAAGKTTTGRLLAEKLGRNFIDLDEWIESREGMSIANIFLTQDEPAFRRIEAEALSEALALVPAVMALGGGTFVDENNRRLLKSSGWSIFLDTPLETILGRLLEAPAARPLNSGDEFLKLLFESRLPAYRQADLRVEPGRDAEETVEKITSELHRLFGGTSDLH